MVGGAVDPHIRFDDVRIAYGGKPALRGISLEIPRHEIFGVIGPANSGKIGRAHV